MHQKYTLLKLLVIFPLFFHACDSLSQYDEFLDSYDLLSTVAGKGDIDAGDINAWLPDYEGGMATNAELSRPHIAMADAAGNIYIADKDAHAIRKVDLQGTISTVAGTSVAGDGNDGLATEQALNAPNGLWVNEEGSFYILDLNNDKIRKVDTEGNMTTIVDDETGIALGRGLWVSNNEDTIWYTSGSQIKMWTEGAGITAYATGFSGLGNIVQDPAGYIVATDRTADRVYRVVKDGSKLVIAGNGTASGGGDEFPAIETGFDGVRGVWFLEDGTYFLATHEGSQVWHIDGNGIAHLFLDGSEGDEYHSGDGENYRTPGLKISEARSVTVDYQGNILVTENDRGFIRKIQKKDVDALLNTSPNNQFVEVHIYPNPFTLTTSIKYILANPSEIKVKIIKNTGQLVELLYDKYQSAGEHYLIWKAQNMPAGLYFCEINSEKHSSIHRLIILD
jgi:hypothetical protein